jgi:hypothetical protein
VAVLAESAWTVFVRSCEEEGVLATSNEEEDP